MGVKKMRAVLKLLVPAAALVLPGVVIAQQDTSDEVIEEIVTTGSRNAAKPRTASDSTVPIDVINDEDFNSLGSTADLTDNLRAMVPSYTATPATGYEFSGWSGDITGTSNPASITMDANKNVTATFTEVQTTQYTLTATQVGLGGVTFNPPGGVYNEGTTRYF